MKKLLMALVMVGLMATSAYAWLDDNCYTVVKTQEQICFNDGDITVDGDDTYVDGSYYLNRFKFNNSKFYTNNPTYDIVGIEYRGGCMFGIGVVNICYDIYFEGYEDKYSGCTSSLMYRE